MVFILYFHRLEQFTSIIWKVYIISTNTTQTMIGYNNFLIWLSARRVIFAFDNGDFFIKTRIFFKTIYNLKFWHGIFITFLQTSFLLRYQDFQTSHVIAFFRMKIKMFKTRKLQSLRALVILFLLISTYCIPLNTWQW